MPTKPDPSTVPPKITEWPDDDPSKWKKKPRDTSVEKKERRPALDYIEGIGFESIIFNLVVLGCIFYLPHLIIKHYTHQPLFTKAIPMALVWTVIVLCWKQMYVNLDALKGKRYLDVLTKRNKVYGPGLHIVALCHRPVAKGEVDFQLADVKACKEENTQIKFLTTSGAELLLDVFTQYRTMQNATDLASALFYTPEETRRKIINHMSSWLSELGGRYSHETIQYYKGEIFKRLALVFDGEDMRSQLELELGITIKNPLGSEIEMSPESLKRFGVKQEVQVIADGAKQIKADLPGASEDQCLMAAMCAAGAAQQTISTLNTPNLPSTVHTLVLGDTGAFAVGGKKGGK